MTAPIQISGEFYVPPGFEGDTRTIVPDEVVTITAETFGLTELGRGLDPACGAYTIPRVLRTLGVNVDAADTHSSAIAVSRHEAAKLDAEQEQNQGIGTGVVRLAALQNNYPDNLYDFIYTSLPFRWFDTPDADPVFASALRWNLTPEGLLVVDSAHQVERDGKALQVAANQVVYLENHGFRLLDLVTFEMPDPPEGSDGQYVELAFVRADSGGRLVS